MNNGETEPTMSDKDVIDKKQRLLLEYLFSNRDLYVQCARVIKPKYFDQPLNRVVTFVQEYFEKYHSLPDFDIIDAETDVELAEQDIEKDEYEYVKDEVEAFCRDEAMSQAILKSVDMLEDGRMGAIQDAVRDALMVKLDNSLGTNLFENPRERIMTMDEQIDERTIGIPALDELMGGIRRGELGVFYGVSGGGKSVMLANLAYYLAGQGLDVAVVSMELNELLYSKRMDAIFTNSSIKNHKENVELIDSSLGKMKSAMGSVDTKFMIAGTVSDVRSYVLEYHLANGKYPDVILVDYLAKMGMDEKVSIGANRFDIDEVKSQGLRDIMAEYNIYGFTAGQINRDGYDITSLSAAHCAGGKSVVDNSDISIALYATEEDIDNNQIQAKQLKIRNNGKTAKPITLYMNPHSLRITDQPNQTVIQGSTSTDQTPTRNPLKRKTSGQNTQGSGKLNDAIEKTKRMRSKRK